MSSHLTTPRLREHTKDETEKIEEWKRGNMGRHITERHLIDMAWPLYS